MNRPGKHPYSDQVGVFAFMPYMFQKFLKDKKKNKNISTNLYYKTYKQIKKKRKQNIVLKYKGHKKANHSIRQRKNRKCSKSL